MIVTLVDDRIRAAQTVSDGEDTTLKSLLTRLLGSRVVTPGDRALPFGVAWAMAGVMAAARRIFRREGDPPITRQMLRLIGKVADPNG